MLALALPMQNPFASQPFIHSDLWSCCQSVGYPLSWPVLIDDVIHMNYNGKLWTFCRDRMWWICHEHTYTYTHTYTATHTSINTWIVQLCIRLSSGKEWRDIRPFASSNNSFCIIWLKLIATVCSYHEAICHAIDRVCQHWRLQFVWKPTSNHQDSSKHWREELMRYLQSFSDSQSKWRLPQIKRSSL